MADIPPISYSSVHDLPKNQTTQNAVCMELPNSGSPLHNINNPGKVQYQPQSSSRNNGDFTQTFVNSGGNRSISTDEIETYKLWSIFNILCCCLCLGCVAYHFSMHTDSLKKQGNIQDALNASKHARLMNIITTIAGIILIGIYIVYQISSHQ